MDRVPVESSDLAYVGYDEQTQTLRVWFHSGGAYEYYGVPRSEHDGLMSATSHGKYFYWNIKNKDKYRYKKLG